MNTNQFTVQSSTSLTNFDYYYTHIESNDHYLCCIDSCMLLNPLNITGATLFLSQCVDHVCIYNELCISVNHLILVWQVAHAQLQLVHPLVQLLVCQSLSPLWCPSLRECWWLLFSATFQEGHHTNQVHMLIMSLCMMRWVLIRRGKVAP